MADELQRCQRGEPIHARRITLLEQLGKWVRRHPGKALGAAAVVLGITGGAAAVTWQWRRATANERQALLSEAAAREISAAAMLAQALGAREHHDFGQARRLLAEIPEALRGFDWRLVHGLRRSDETGKWLLPGGDSSGTPACLANCPVAANSLSSPPPVCFSHSIRKRESSLHPALCRRCPERMEPPGTIAA